MHVLRYTCGSNAASLLAWYLKNRIMDLCMTCVTCVCLCMEKKCGSGKNDGVIDFILSVWKTNIGIVMLSF